MVRSSDYYVIGLPDMAEEIVKSCKVCAMTNTGNSMYTPDKRFRGNRPEAYWEGDFTEIKPDPATVSHDSPSGSTFLRGFRTAENTDGKTPFAVRKFL